MSCNYLSPSFKTFSRDRFLKLESVISKKSEEVARLEEKMLRDFAPYRAGEYVFITKENGRVLLGRIWAVYYSNRIFKTVVIQCNKQTMAPVGIPSREINILSGDKIELAKRVQG